MGKLLFFWIAFWQQTSKSSVWICFHLVISLVWEPFRNVRTYRKKHAQGYSFAGLFVLVKNWGCDECPSAKSCLRQCGSWPEVVLPPRTFANIWRHFWFSHLGKCYWHLVGGDQDAANHPTRQPLPKITQLQMSAVLRVRNTGSNKTAANGKKRVNLCR